MAPTEQPLSRRPEPRTDEPGSGATRRAEGQEDATDAAGERTLAADLRRLRERAASAQRSATRGLASAVAAEPYWVAAAALGAGFVLGGGLTRQMRAVMVGVGARVVGAWIGEQALRRTSAGGLSDDEAG